MINVDAGATVAPAKVGTREAETAIAGMTDVQLTIDAHAAPDMWSQALGGAAVSETAVPRLVAGFGGVLVAETVGSCESSSHAHQQDTGEQATRHPIANPELLDHVPSSCGDQSSLRRRLDRLTARIRVSRSTLARRLALH
jgi:hypothetical protein